MELANMDANLLTEVSKRLDNQKDKINLVATNKAMFNDICKVTFQELQEQSLQQILAITKQFVTDCTTGIKSALTTNDVLREKYFNMFVHGYTSTDVIPTFNHLREYNWECSAIAKDCDCFGAEEATALFNAFKYYGKFQIPEQEDTYVRTMKHVAMQSLFEFSVDSTYDHGLVISWESGAELELMLEVTETDTHLFIEFRGYGSGEDVQDFGYDLLHEHEDTSWIEHLHETIKGNINKGYLFGALTDIRANQDLFCESWRRAYILLECMPTYKHIR